MSMTKESLLADALREIVDRAHRQMIELQNSINAPRIEFWNEQIVTLAHDALEASAKLEPTATVQPTTLKYYRQVARNARKAKKSKS